MGLKKIGIIGAGPAGSFCAYKLAKAGFEVLLFDHKAVWDKPCGGGLTAPVWEQFPELMPLQEFCYPNENARLITSTGHKVEIKLANPLYVISRKQMAQFLLDTAVSAGAKFIPKRILKLARKNSGFELEDTDSVKIQVDFLIAADGVNSLVRKTFCPRWRIDDYYFTLSLLAPRTMNPVLTVQFFHGLYGYAWIFPGKETLSIGIGVRMRTHKLDKIYSFLEQTLDQTPDTGISKEKLRSDARGFLIPALGFSSLRAQKVIGDNWALIGDASGSANSVTGEGLYYAFKTAHLLAQALISGKPDGYQHEWWGVCKKELAGPSLWGSVFFHKWSQKIFSNYVSKSASAQKLASQLMVGMRLKRTEIMAGILKAFFGG